MPDVKVPPLGHQSPFRRLVHWNATLSMAAVMGVGRESSAKVVTTIVAKLWSVCALRCVVMVFLELKNVEICYTGANVVSSCKESQGPHYPLTFQTRRDSAKTEKTMPRRMAGGV